MSPRRTNDEDRRRAPRCRAVLPYRLVWSGGSLTGLTKNLSLTGALLDHERVPEEFEEKSESEEISLYLEMEDQKIVIKCHSVRAENLVLSGSSIVMISTVRVTPETIFQP